MKETAFPFRVPSVSAALVVYGNHYIVRRKTPQRAAHYTDVAPLLHISVTLTLIHAFTFTRIHVHNVHRNTPLHPSWFWQKKRGRSNTGRMETVPAGNFPSLPLPRLANGSAAQAPRGVRKHAHAVVRAPLWPPERVLSLRRRANKRAGQFPQQKLVDCSFI